jgi:hypothetical protein
MKALGQPSSGTFQRAPLFHFIGHISAFLGLLLRKAFLAERLWEPPP